LLGFNGELPDPLTGCYHLGNGYRQFNPVLMRFNRPDSWSPFGEGGLNAYGYCGGDPRNRRDPSGHRGEIVKFLRSFFKKAPTKPKTKNSVSVVLASSDDISTPGKRPSFSFSAPHNTVEQLKSNDNLLDVRSDLHLFEPNSSSKNLQKAQSISNESLDHLPIMSKHGRIKNYEVRDPEKASQRKLQRQIDQRMEEFSNEPDPNRFLYRSGGF
ncbi:RHS repeat-associated core domain-containing protein, partial [Pseudomonas sp. GM78]|uniref:RHS repeat-associated core domain-containing protein n=1 Tax=Pseudomonas sp. GM78 TaxID=1144337 RepID=UPI001EE67B36